MKTCVILPTYNNCKTLAEVIQSVKARIPHVIVVDDGSTDGTREVLRGITELVVMHHEKNRGKGAAMMSGFAKGRELGFDRAITIDTDGQHLAEDIPAFLEAARREPEAIFVGSRKRVGPVAWSSRLANRLSDFWFKIESGTSLPDTQCGFRSYPLELVERLRLNKTRYDFEVEILVKAAWLGVALRPVPVTAVYFSPEKRVSHFLPLIDSLRIFHLFALFFLFRFFLPSGFQKVLCENALSRASFPWKLALVGKDFLNEAFSEPLQFSLSIGLGMALGIWPIWGAQTISAAFMADRLSLNKFAAVVASNVSFPAVIPFIFYAALVIGHFLFSGVLDFRPALTGPVSHWAPRLFWEWFWGSVLLGILAGMVGGALTYLFIFFANRFRGPIGYA